jgi:fibronectin type 3 domain-containing protein
MASISWSAATGASTYNVYRGTTSGGESLDTSGVTGTFFEDSGLGDGTTYYYEITAVNSSGESARSTEVSVTTLPATPATFTATPGDSQVALQWSASPSATAYRVYRDTVGGAGGAANFVVTGTSYTDKGLLNGTTYYYSAVPINASGENHSAGAGGSATPVASSSSEAPAGAPTSVRATAGNALTVLNWGPVSNATVYDIFRGTSTGSETLLHSSVAALTYTDSGLSNGTTYYYKIRGDNGSVTGTLSSEVNATPSIPAAPSAIHVTPGSNIVTLNWTAAGTSYAIYRSTTPGTETMLDSGLTGSTYTDAAVTNGTTYYYKVQALNPGGSSPLSSEVSAAPSGAAASSWTGTINFNLPGEPVQTCLVTIPDINRPVQAAMLTSEGSNMMAIATKYNAVVLGIDGFTQFNFGTTSSPIYLQTPNDGHAVCLMDYRWPQLGAQRVQAALTAAAQATSHPEIANTGLILYGFSEGVDNTNLTVTPYYNGSSLVPSPLDGRVLAVVQLSELDEDVVNPISTLDTAPHLFLSSGLSDGQSSLNQGLEDIPQVTHDTLARGIATNQGGPLTVIDNAGQGHGDDQDNSFISAWLDSVLSQRTPSPSTSAAVSLPSWQNSSAWVGTYNIATSTSSPWGSAGNAGLQLVNNLISPRSAYPDARPFTWLPSQSLANAWLAYSNTGLAATLNPVITSGTPPSSGTTNSAYSFTLTATGYPAPTFSITAGSLPTGLSLSPSGTISGTPGAVGVFTVTITATNGIGAGATQTLTITVTNAPPATDTPTLPPWGLAILAALLVLTASKLRPTSQASALRS